MPNNFLEKFLERKLRKKPFFITIYNFRYANTLFLGIAALWQSKFVALYNILFSCFTWTQILFWQGWPNKITHFGQFCKNLTNVRKSTLSNSHDASNPFWQMLPQNMLVWGQGNGSIQGTPGQERGGGFNPLTFWKKCKILRYKPPVKPFLFGFSPLMGPAVRLFLYKKGVNSRCECSLGRRNEEVRRWMKSPFLLQFLSPVQFIKYQYQELGEQGCNDAVLVKILIAINYLENFSRKEFCWRPWFQAPDSRLHLGSSSSLGRLFFTRLPVKEGTPLF